MKVEDGVGTNRFDALELTPEHVRWDESQDTSRLCQCLIDLSSPDLSPLFGTGWWVDADEINGFALYIRSRLPFEEAKSTSATADLLDLTYSGKNRAFLASLCATLPSIQVQKEIAGFCSERLLAGSKHSWEKVLVQLPTSLTERTVYDLLNSSDADRLSRLLYSLQEYSENLSDANRERIIALAAVSEDKVRFPACNLALTFPASALLDKESIIAGYLAECSQYMEPDSIGVGEYLPIAYLYERSGDTQKSRYADLLLGCVSTETDRYDADKIADCARALAQTQSPLLHELLKRVGEVGQVEPIRKTAVALRKTLTGDTGERRLNEIATELPHQTCFGAAVLSSSLGYTPCMESVWQAAQATGDTANSLLLISTLAFGGNHEAIYSLSQLEQSLHDSISNAGGDTNLEPLRSWAHMQDDLIGALISWAYQPADAVPLRWRALLGTLRIGERNFYRTQSALSGMAEMCRRGHFPSSKSYSVSESAETWLAHLFPFTITDTDIPRLCAYTGDTSLWITEKVSNIKASYLSGEAVMAPLRGDPPPLDADQQQASTVFSQAMERVYPLVNDKQLGASILQLAPILDIFSRVPLQGKKRQQMRCEIEYLLAWCYGGVTVNEEKDSVETINKVFSDISALNISMLEEGSRRFFLHAGRAIRAALSIDDNDGLSRVTEMFELQRQDDLMALYVRPDHNPKKETVDLVNKVDELIKSTYQLLHEKRYQEAMHGLFLYAGPEDKLTIGENRYYKHNEVSAITEVPTISTPVQQTTTSNQPSIPNPPKHTHVTTPANGVGVGAGADAVVTPQPTPPAPVVPPIPPSQGINDIQHQITNALESIRTSIGCNRRVFAGVLGILFGWLGAHRFYLGYTYLGIAQIIVTLVTCGWGALWGTVEGILILAGQAIQQDAQKQPLER